jgi:sortase A
MGIFVAVFLGHLISQKSASPSQQKIGSNATKEVAADADVPAKIVNYGLPARVKIPKLGIDAPIGYLGLTKRGDMAIPTNIAEVGWYKNGPLPGNKGSAILAGHVNGPKGQPGVFASLHKLQKGDTLQVIDSKNTIISFMVRETRIYGKDAQPDEVFKATDTAHLNLITCTGAWDKAQKQFQERLVVFTDKM